LPHIDFGTYHLLSRHLGQSLEWSERWIERHIAAARKAGKPALLESTVSSQAAAMPASSSIPSVGSGPMRAGTTSSFTEVETGRSSGCSPDVDDMRRAVPTTTISPFTTMSTNAPFIRSFATAMTKNAQACTLYRRLTPAGSIARSPFVTTAPRQAVRPPSLFRISRSTLGALGAVYFGWRPSEAGGGGLPVWRLSLVALRDINRWLLRRFSTATSGSGQAQ